ncbi:MAG: nucleoside-diphosphate kinase [Parcubacteria group bacterium]|nr:nucleoside-diphosphate kinase [Parcubacteria group bacterium]
MTERTLVILKPDAVQRKLEYEILKRFARKGLAVVVSKRLMAKEDHLDRHFPNTEEWMMNMGERAVGRWRAQGEDPKKIYGADDPLEIGKMIAAECRLYYQEGPLEAVVLEGENAIALVRKMLGSPLPSQAAKETIRGYFAAPPGPRDHLAARNLIHASDSPKEAEREMAVWFTPEEMAKGGRIVAE